MTLDDRPVLASLRPMTEAQSGLWFAQKRDPTNPIFNTAHLFDIRGPIDVVAFRKAADQAAREAEAFSLRFVEADGEVLQSTDPARAPLVVITDLGGRADAEGQALAAIRRDVETPVDPRRDALAASLLFVLGPNRVLWAVRVHHLATDGFGMVLYSNRVAELYNAQVAGAVAGPRFPPLSQALDEAENYRASERRVQDAAFWREAMSGADEVVGLAPGRAVTADRFHRVETRLSSGLTSRLRARADAARLSWPDVLTALTGAYCRRFAGVEEMTIGVPHMGRLGSASARVPAMVMNVLPLRLAADEDRPLEDWLIGMSKTLIRARRHGRYRSEQLRRDLGLIGGSRRLYGPLINVLPFDQPPRFERLSVQMRILGAGPVDDLSITFRGDATPNLTLEIDANPDLYDAQTCAAHAERLALFIEHALDAATLAEVPTATPAEAEREIARFNDTAHPVPDTTLATLLEQAMRDRPDAEAVVFEGARLTYAELDRRSRDLADRLTHLGVGPDSIVAVALPRSVELVVALVGVLRTGGAYLPLDLDHPAGRLRELIRSAEPRVVLALADIEDVFADRLLTPDAWTAADAVPSPALRPDHAAYVIYTSGSTGAPKGVLVEHRAIVNRLLWMQAAYGVGPHSRILQKTPATFDVSVWEFFLPLIAGGTLVVSAPGAHRDPAAIGALLRDQAITDVHFVPSMLSAFLAHPASQGLSVDHVFCSGEELTAELRDRFHQTVTGELHNLYGPTEAAVDVSYWPASADDTSRPVPIGHAVWNTRLLILDEALRPVARGMAGRLFLGGVQLARGYLGRPDLTAERFIADPFHPGERLYDTGDLARRRDDGAVVYLGRADHQVKIRGLRIELGEIEAAILDTGLAAECVVIVREDRAGDRRLVGYVVPGEAFDADALRTALARRLPDYMVPGAVVALDALPVTLNGKLDRKSLPAPAATIAHGRAPRTSTETILADLYAEILGRDGPASAEDDFFALGGDSLLAVHLLLAVSARFGRDPGLGALFDHPRLEDFAALIDAGESATDHGLGPLIRLAEGDPHLPPLFVIHPAGGLAWGYRTLARSLTPRRTVWGVQSPALDPDVPAPESIEALAAQYAQTVIAVGAPGPIHLLGWSVGGIIAQAMGERLEALGRSVGLVAMLDSYPAECWRAEPEPDAVAALRALLAIAGHDPEAHPELQTREAVVGFLKAGSSALGSLPETALNGVIRAVLDTNRLVRRHYHRRYAGRLTHVRAALDHVGKPLHPDLWLPYAGELDVVEASFLHSQLTGPAAVAVIAPALDTRMAAAETKDTRS